MRSRLFCYQMKTFLLFAVTKVLLLLS